MVSFTEQSSVRIIPGHLKTKHVFYILESFMYSYELKTHFIYWYF